jgi:hypothetical protein
MDNYHLQLINTQTTIIRWLLDGNWFPSHQVTGQDA